MPRPILALVAVLLLHASALAQPLADKVPADAIVYIGWQGSDHMPASYSKTHLKAVLELSAARDLFDQFLPALIQKIGLTQPKAADIMKIVSGVGAPLFRHPTAVYFAGADFAPGTPPKPRMGLICQAGADAQALSDWLTQLAEMAQGAGVPFPINVFRDGDLIVVAVGYDKAEEALAGKGNVKSISTNPNFAAALKHGRAESNSIAYVDMEALTALADKVVAAYHPQEQAQWTAIRDALALNGVKRILSTSAFDGADWATNTFISAPAPRKGLAAWIDAAPITDEALKTVPKSATWVAAGRINFSALITAIREVAGQIEPEAQKKIDMGLGALRLFLAMDIQKDFLEALGEEWVAYSDPDSTGLGVMGTILVNRLNRPADAEKALEKLELSIANAVNSQLIEAKMQISFEKLQRNGLTIHYVSVPFVAPAYAIADGNLYVGLYPQMVASAVTNAKSGKSILENENFTALRKRLGGEKAAGIRFLDLPRSSAEGYQTILGLSQVGLGFGDLFGVKSPQMLLPPFHELKPHMMPAGGFSWTDADGWHAHDVSPFPCAEMFSPQAGAMVTAAPALASIMLPAISKARESAQRLNCMNNLRQIYFPVLVYADEHNGQLPPDLGALVSKGKINLRVFVCPSHNGVVPENIMMGKPEDQAIWINKNADYVYIGANLKGLIQAGTTILAYDKPENHEHQGVSVLFLDGHVEWMPIPEAMQRIEKQTGKKPEGPK